MTTSSAAKVAVLTSEKCELIATYRTDALKIARSLLRRWGTNLDISEIQSISDLALCEAARKFDVERGSSFITYLFLYIKGALIADLASRRKYATYCLPESDEARSSCGRIGQYSEAIIDEASADENFSPEYQMYRKELRQICRQALGALKPMERETVIEVNFREQTIAGLARREGMSRPYLSSLHSRSIRKLQPFFEQLVA